MLFIIIPYIQKQLKKDVSKSNFIPFDHHFDIIFRTCSEFCTKEVYGRLQY